MNWNDRANRNKSRKQRAEEIAEDLATMARTLGLPEAETSIDERDPTKTVRQQVEDHFRARGCTCNPEIHRISEPETGIKILAVGHAEDCGIDLEPGESRVRQNDPLANGDIPEAL